MAATVAGRRDRGRGRCGRHGACCGWTCPTPDLWWPRGHGEQPLYPLEVALLSGGHRAGRRGGAGSASARSTLDTTPDDARHAVRPRGQRRPIFVRGVNWIPDDCFPSRDRPRRATSAASARPPRPTSTCSGSGAAASTRATTSTSLCRRAGLLVWQDFLFACAAYPEEEPLRSEVVAEARENVTRLAPHPSLVLWNGNNENIWGYEDWGWQDELGERTWGAGYYHDAAARRSSPSSTRRGPTAPGSPYSGSRPAHAPERPGPRHHAHLGRLEHARLHRLPRLRPAVRRRVRLPGAARPGRR